MHLNYNSSTKSLGSLAASLVLTLYERNRPVFHLREAVEILGGCGPAKNALSQLVRHGFATRLKPGVFRLIPLELGFEREYLGNFHIIARELAASKRGEEFNGKPDYYLSHGSAFELHQMVTQPQLLNYVSSPRMVRSRIIQGAEFRFIRCRVKDLFGIEEMWVEKNEKVCVSNLERTLLDGLKEPAYCGGLSEVAKGFSIKQQLINSKKLVDYALKLEIGAVIRRLGLIMELYGIGTSIEQEVLKSKLTKTYHLLDPGLPNEGHFLAKWRLRLNVSQDELLALRRT